MIKTAEINQRLLDDLPVIRLPKFVPPGAGLSIWWMGDDRITFQATSADTNGAYAFWVDEPPGQVGPPKHVHSGDVLSDFGMVGLRVLCQQASHHRNADA
jgi:hypothetical protein